MRFCYETLIFFLFALEFENIYFSIIFINSSLLKQNIPFNTKTSRNQFLRYSGYSIPASPQFI